MGKALIYRQIMAEYDNDRLAAGKKAEMRKKEIYKKFSRIEEIDREIEENGLGVLSAALSLSDRKKREEFLKETEEKNNFLFEEKKAILKSGGYDENYMTDVYKCGICRDTGKIGTEKCKCFKQRFIDKSYDLSNLGSKLNYENFDNFDFSFFSEDINEKEGISPRKNIEKIFERCTKFIKNFERKKDNLIFYGKAGRGKTFMCSCIAKELLDKGYTVLYVSAFQLFKMIENIRFNRADKEESSDYTEFIQEADLLIIDDLGTEFATSLSAAELFNIVNSRLNREMSTVISTNLSPRELENQYSDRLTSRLYGNYTVLEFISDDDIRIMKKIKS